MKIRRIHPYIFTVAALIFSYRSTTVIVPPSQVLRPLLILLVVVLGLGFVFSRIVKDLDWAAVLLSIFVLGFCATETFFLLVGVISILAFTLWWPVMIWRKREFSPGQVTLFLNIIAVFLVIWTTAQVLPLFMHIPWKEYQAEILRVQNSVKIDIVDAKNKPDIYYIVLDGYARADVLNEFYGYENHELIDYLESKGFIIPSSSYSNYPKTALSVASTLNLDYIHTDAMKIENNAFWWLMSPLIEQSLTRNILEENGYDAVSIVTDWGVTNNSTTDLHFKPYPIQLNDFESYLLEHTPLAVIKPLLEQISFVPSFRAHGHLIKYSFQTLSEIPTLPEPTFTFVHLISPHPPFIFDEDGNLLDKQGAFSFNDANDYSGSKEEYRQGYVAQVQFINKHLIETIEAILYESDVPPIIILQADHGPGMLTDFRSSENTCLKERFSVFSAYYFPSVDERSIPNDISAVNVFRVLFNEYFDAELPLLENKFYYYEDTVYIYRTEDVTDQIDRACLAP